ncbi:hypothetical protein VTK73DRAFT_8476 [Phialemonium thermophilum]|uniref:Protein BIG1 n=1 Tax=Phialemonium thermophilum TaxID=223376 RepID=A0ABR3W8E6_9PEZI
MRLSLASIAIACVAEAQAFSDSSPFILFSTAEFSAPSENAQLQTRASVLRSVTDILSSCPTDRYLLASQPGAHAVDIRDEQSSCSMPNLCRAIASERVHGRYGVAEVVTSSGAEHDGNPQVAGFQSLADSIQSACQSRGKSVGVDEVKLAPLSGSVDSVKRRETRANNDYELGKFLDALDGDYTVILYSEPSGPLVYEPSFQEPVHMDLKRQLDPLVLRSRADSLPDNRPLFEKYQFFTPGIFMALIVAAVMLSILGVGLKAVASLQVSYGAFDKEMGPAAQKKQL